MQADTFGRVVLILNMLLNYTQNVRKTSKGYWFDQLVIFIVHNEDETHFDIESNELIQVWNLFTY